MGTPSSERPTENDNDEINIRNRLETFLKNGREFMLAGKHNDAESMFQNALALAEKIDDKIFKLNVFNNLGILSQNRGDYPKAMEFYQQSLTLSVELKDKNGESAVLGNLGNVYDNLGNYPRAIEFRQKQLTLAEEIGNKLNESIALGNLGISYSNLGDYPKAIEYYQKSLRIAQEIGDRRGEGMAYGNLGNAYDSLGDYPKAIEYQEKQLKIVQNIGDKQGEGNAYSNLGSVYASLGDYPKAIEYQEKYLKIALEIGDRQGVGVAYGNLGNAFRYLGDYSRAIEYQEKALKINQQIGDKQGEGAAFSNLGNAYLRLGNYSKAIEYHEKSLRIAGEIGDRQGEGNAYSNLGNAYSNLEDYSKAIEYHEKSLRIAGEIGDRQGEGNAYGNLGNVYLSLGDYSNAIERVIRASLIFLQIQSPNIRQVSNILRSIRQKVGAEEFERLIEVECNNIGVEWAQYRRALEQFGLMNEESQEGVDPQLAALGRVIGLALAGDKEAQQVVVEQILPQLERAGSGFERLGRLVRRLLDGELEITKFEEELARLDETDRTIMGLAIQTTNEAIQGVESNGSEDESEPQSEKAQFSSAMTEFLGLVVAAASGQKEASVKVQPILEQMLEDKNTRKFAARLELLLEGERSAETLTRGLDEPSTTMITLVLEQLKQVE